MDKLTGSERAALVTLDVVNNGGTNTRRVMEITGLESRSGAWRLLCMLSRCIIPLYYDRRDNWWHLCDHVAK